MGKNMTKKKRQTKQKQRQKYLRTGALSLLVVLGLGTMVGMAMFNANAKPQRDMKWYIRDAVVEVAAPALGDGYDDGQDASDAPATAGRTEDTAQREEPARADRDEPVQEAVQDEPAGDGPVLAVITPQPTEQPTSAPTEQPTQAPTAEPEPEIEATYEPLPEEEEEDYSGTVKLTITAAGDCTFGGEVGSKGRRRFVDLVDQYGYDYFFQNVRPVFEADDLTIVNLEGPLTTVENSNKHGFVFKGDPEYANILTGSSVELCNLANNHTLDYGTAGLKETANVLDAAKVGYCGFTKVYNAKIKGVRVCALGFTWWDFEKEQMTKAIASVRPDCDLLIVNIHWGVEGQHNQDAKQQALAHAMVDAGADLIIGTHPHVYQGIEKYRGKYIVYSLGNFCFAGNANPADKRCLVFQQTFSFNPGMGIAQANIMDAGINIIPCTVSSVRDKNDFQPTIMAAKEGADLLKAVASRSTNFSLTTARWMKDNYMLTYGLIQDENDESQQPVTAVADGQAPAGDAGEDASAA